MEIIVADSSTDHTPDLISSKFTDVRLLQFQEPLTISQLRGRGIASARGQIIAVLDPYSMVTDDWLSELLRIHSVRPNLIIGGTVELYGAASASVFSWATYINEYGMFMSPVREGETKILPGSNISYKREVLFEDSNPRFPEFWKTFVNGSVEEQNSPLWLAPSIVVCLNKPISFGDYWRTRFHHGRCFAGMRNASAGSGERVFRAITAPGIPFVLLWRWSKIYWAKRRYRSKLLTTLPFQILLFGNWAFGELVGYCTGSGQSCDKLYY